MARRGDPRGPSNAHVRVHVGGALVPRSAKWGRLVRRFWPVFGTLEYAAGTMDAGWPPNAGEQGRSLHDGLRNELLAEEAETSRRAEHVPFAATGSTSSPPSAQAALGSLFCDVANPSRQLIVETHSDHLLDRVRMDIRDGKTRLKPDDVSILFFERDDLNVLIHSLRPA